MRYALLLEVGIVLVIGILFAAGALRLGFFSYVTDAALTVSRAPSTGEEYIETFSEEGVLNESVDEETTSPHWWLNSGGEFIMKNDVGSTIQGSLPQLHRWRLTYAHSNPLDTDGGYYPQNIFRLVSRTAWIHPRLEASFRVIAENNSSSPNRNESNGLFFMMRYVDQDNLYYAGLRVDGYAVIKKKYHGVYYTMAEKKVITGVYERNAFPNLLPRLTWIRLSGEIKTNPDGSVSVHLAEWNAKTRAWEELVSARDDGVSFGGPAIHGYARIGIRTDFMDVEFDTVRVEEVPETL